MVVGPTIVSNGLTPMAATPLVVTLVVGALMVVSSIAVPLMVVADTPSRRPRKSCATTTEGRTPDDQKVGKEKRLLRIQDILTVGDTDPWRFAWG